MVYKIINDYRVFADWLYWLFGFILPALFFTAILVWTLADGRYLSRKGAMASKFSHSEPLVLLLIGVIFLFLNREQLQALPVAALIRLTSEPGISQAKNLSLINYSYLIYTFATISICASLAKAFWTHVRLEQHFWGPLDYYSAFGRRSGLIRALELSLRCLIAIMVLLLQKHLSLLKYVKHIGEIRLQSGIPQQFETDFIVSFAAWQADFAKLFMVMYAAILVWLFLAHRINRSNSKITSEELRKAVHGTLWSTGPGLIIAWLLYFTATGRWIPSLYDQTPVNLQWWMIPAACSGFVICGAVVLVNLVIILWCQVRPVVWDSWKIAYCHGAPAARAK